MEKDSFMAHQFIDEIKRILESSLPASSVIVAKVINTIISKSSSAKDLADIITHDPPLSAKLLKTANSAYYGSAAKITTIQRAIVVLGFDTIRDLVTTITLIDNINNKETESKEIDRMGLWYHSVGTAKACRLIAEKTRIEQPDVAYIVGLLHDIGKILLALSFPEDYSNVVQLASMKNTRIILSERKILNTDHTMIGKVLCDIWGLPDDISTAILYHHDPMEVPKGSQKLARIVELGDFICRKAKIGNPGDSLTPEPSPATLALLGKERDKMRETFRDVFQELYKSKEEIANFFETQKSA